MSKDYAIGQHVGTPGGTADNGQKETPRDPELGKKAVPASKPGSDIETERKA
jgi:hypothetical protein